MLKQKRPRQGTKLEKSAQHLTADLQKGCRTLSRSLFEDFCKMELSQSLGGFLQLFAYFDLLWAFLLA